MKNTKETNNCRKYPIMSAWYKVIFAEQSLRQKLRMIKSAKRVYQSLTVSHPGAYTALLTLTQGKYSAVLNQHRKSYIRASSDFNLMYLILPGLFFLGRKLYYYFQWIDVFKVYFIKPKSSSINGSVDRGCWIHRLHLRREVRLLLRMSRI